MSLPHARQPEYRMVLHIPPNLPLNLLNTNFLARLLIIVIPLALTQIYSRELRGISRRLGLPVTLYIRLSVS